MTKSEEIQARRAKYDRVERATDELGRAIGVKMLKPSQKARVEELAPGLNGYDLLIDEDRDSKTFGKELRIPKITNLMIAAAVVEIDGLPYTFPKNRAELDAVYDHLDDEGILAARMAMMRFYPSDDDAKKADPANPGEGLENEAKN